MWLGVVVLWHSVAACAQNNPSALLRQTFIDFKSHYGEVSQGARAQLTVGHSPTLWVCSDGAARLWIDVNGNLSFQRIEKASSPSEGQTTAAADDQALIARTREFAKTVLTPDQAASFSAKLKQEVLRVVSLPNGDPQRMSGRRIIRLTGPAQFMHAGHFQAMFDPQGRLMRVDLAFLENSRGKALAKSLFPGGTALAASVKPMPEKPVTLGCFYSPREYRFEVSALHTEDEPFLNVQIAGNPFGRDNFDLSSETGTLVPLYVQSKDYRWWSWQHWQQYGRVGTFRGNWMSQSGGSWENANRVMFHRSLTSYAFVQGPPTKTRVLGHGEPKPGEKRYPFGASFDFGQPFYDDLEKCNVAFFYTHGGKVNGIYQMQQQFDVWVHMMPPTGALGQGHLRHLFLVTCSAFTDLREPQSAHLMQTWIRKAKVAGLRTACGTDGEETMLEGTAWEFFGYYNKGDSISDAWTMAMLDENFRQFPVTLAYGSSPEDALQSLRHGRFSDEPAAAKYAAISDWTDAEN